MMRRFSLMQKCFPAAVPSPFTSQRQDLYDIYSRIASSSRAAAAPAQDASVAEPHLPTRNHANCSEQEEGSYG